MYDRNCYPHPGKNQQGGEDKGDGIHCHPVAIFVVAFGKLVFRQVGNWRIVASETPERGLVANFSELLGGAQREADYPIGVLVKFGTARSHDDSSSSTQVYPR